MLLKEMSCPIVIPIINQFEFRTNLTFNFLLQYLVFESTIKQVKKCGAKKQSLPPSWTHRCGISYLHEYQVFRQDFFTLRSFVRNLLWGNSRRNIFFFFHISFWSLGPGIRTRAFTSNMLIQYLLDYGDFTLLWMSMQFKNIS